MYSEHRCMGHPGTLDGNPGHTSYIQYKWWSEVEMVVEL